MTTVVVLGAGGFIGRSLVARLRAEGRPVLAVTRADLPDFLRTPPPACDIVYCIGLTADFRTRRLEAAEAHAGLVARVLALEEIRSFLYLSSTRVYGRNEATREDAPLVVQPSAPGDLYNLSKLAGEALCLSDPRPTVRVARLSNVFGPGMGTTNFLGQVLAEGAASGAVTLWQSMHSAKDYIAVEDVLTALLAIAERGATRLYNVASGANITHDAIARVLSRELGWQFTAHGDTAAVRYPRIDISRLAVEFAAPRNTLIADLPRLARSFAQEFAC